MLYHKRMTLKVVKAKPEVLGNLNLVLGSAGCIGLQADEVVT